MTRFELVEILNGNAEFGPQETYNVLAEVASGRGKTFTPDHFRLLEMVGGVQGVLDSIIETRMKEYTIIVVEFNGRVVKYI